MGFNSAFNGLNKIEKMGTMERFWRGCCLLLIIYKTSECLLTR